MTMQHFDSDYMEGAHPRILQKLMKTNLDKMPGYGSDDYCRSAKEKIRAACGCPQAQVYFLVGGTQTNTVVIKALLRPYEGVISAETGHIRRVERHVCDGEIHLRIEYGAEFLPGRKLVAHPHPRMLIHVASCRAAEHYRIAVSQLIGNIIQNLRI